MTTWTFYWLDGTLWGRWTSMPKETATTTMSGIPLHVPGTRQSRRRPMPDQFPRRRYPCDECPIRADNADNPRSKFPAHRWTELTATVRTSDGGSPPIGTPMFGCHKGAPGTDEDLACAGWLAVFGANHVAVRLAVATKRLPVEALSPGADWPPLHETWEAVVSAQAATEAAIRAHAAEATEKSNG